MTPPAIACALAIVALSLLGLGCSSSQSASAGGMGDPDAPPPNVRAWMDRLTVSHEYDPKTGFIVAKETVALPAIIAEGPSMKAAVERAGSERVVIAFATADRCAPCQQYKKDALNNAEVITRLSDPRFVPTHVEVDRSPELADEFLGSRGIPMTYALREGKVIAVLRGQRSASELLAWLDALPK